MLDSIPKALFGLLLRAASRCWDFRQALAGYLFYADDHQWPEVSRARFDHRDSRLISVDTRLADQDKSGAAVEYSKCCTITAYTLRRGGDATLVCRHHAANLCRR